MSTISFDKMSLRASLLAFSLGLAGLVTTGQAVAGCASFSAPPLAPTLREAPTLDGFQTLSLIHI